MRKRDRSRQDNQKTGFKQGTLVSVGKSFLLLAICWLLIVGLLGLMAVVSNGAIVLRRRRLWSLIAETEGVQQAKKVFLFASFISLLLSVVLLFIHLVVD